MDRRITAAELLAERDEISVLLTAVTALLLEGAAGEVADLRGKVAARLRGVAELHGADDVVIAAAERELESVLMMLREE